MELDLDSFVSSSDSGSDSENDVVPHRSLDELLISSSSGSDSDSDPNPNPLSSNSHQHDRVLNPSHADSVPSESPTPARSFSLPGPSRSIWKLPSSSSSNRQLPSLFGGVRSTAKPGAALAAAAAASRAVPTPHAAALKSRRAAAAATHPVEGCDANSIESSSVATENSEGLILDGVESEGLGDLDLETGSGNNVLHEGSGVIGLESDKNVELGLEDRVEENGGTVLLDEGSGNLGVDASVGVDVSCVSGVEGDGIGDEDARMGVLEEGNELEQRDPTSTGSGGGGGEDGNDDDEDGDGDDEGSSTSDISELVEERIGQLESERINKRAEKKMKVSLKPLELAEELEKKQAFTGLHWVEGAAAQPMRLEGVRRGSTTLGYFDVDFNNFVTRTVTSQAFRRDYGSPQVLAVHVNCIGIGMTKGVIVVVPNRYSPYNPDNLDAVKMLMLGLQSDRSYASVTAMCINQPGDLLLAGYGDGHITLWDIQKGSAAKVVYGEHNAPVVHALFLSQDSQVTRQFKAVTGDSKGLVQLHTISVVPLINRFNINTQCLLDGQTTGTVLSASPLILEESIGGTLSSSQGNTSVSTNSIGRMMGGVVSGDAGWKLFNEGSSLVEEGVVVFATHQTALVVRLSPSLQIYAQLSKPDGVREGSVPYTAWKCTHLHSSSENTSADAGERVSLLAVAWDRKVQVARLVKSELKVYGKWSLDSAAIGVAWLDSYMLVVLTVMGQLYLFARDGTVIHQTTFAIDRFGGDDIVAYHTHFLNVFGNPEKAYHNSIAVRGASIYILGPMNLIISRLLPWKERIHVLRSAGDWMGALNMAMILYDGQAHGVIDLPRSVDAARAIIMPYLVELILSHVEEVFSYISVAFCNQMGKVEQDDSKSRSSSVDSDIKEQFTRVGGVAVEFCVHIQRKDILFEEIFSKFVAVHHKDTFLELLEPYILRDMLGSLPPEIMQALVEHYSSKGWLQRVEQCVLHMDISSLDFNQVVRLCRENGLYGALIYLFNRGLDDFRAPLEELLMVSRNSQKEIAASLGYRMLVYLKYCFSGLAFPPGHGYLDPTRLPSLRTELVQFLLENMDAQNLQALQRLSWGETYLNLYHFLELDTEATLDVLRCAFVDDENPKPDSSKHDSAYASTEFIMEKSMMVESQNELVQSTIDALVHIIEKGRVPIENLGNGGDNESLMAKLSKKDVGHLFEFISYHVTSRKAHISGSVLTQILEFLTSEDDSRPNMSPHDAKTLRRREKQVLALLETVPETDWDTSYVQQLCEKASFHQVCGLIHKARHQYLAALDSYMKDTDEPIHTFSYISNTLQHLNAGDAFRSAILSRIPELVILSRECTFLLVIDHFINESSDILSNLRTQPRSLFLYLKTVIEVYLSGTLNFSYLIKDDNDDVFSGRVKDETKGNDEYLKRISDFPKLVRNNPVSVTDDMIELYLELLCQYERNSVLKFLETFDSYRVEHCLRLCQEYGIIDAAAFLLERVGDVGSALLLTLSALNDKFVALDAALGSTISNKPTNRSAKVDNYNNVLKMKEVQDIYNIVQACILLCQRNTPRLVPEESETLWFKLLDSFCGPLMDTSSEKRVLKQDDAGQILAETFGSRDADEACIIKWKIPKSHKGANLLRKLLSQFIKEIVEGMTGYVHLPTIMSKLLSDNGSQEFGDFKITILGMLGTYGFERRILDTAKSLIEDDTFYTMSLLKKGVCHGYAPRSLVCCICNCLLSRNSPGFRIRIFNCGHATHLQCELENESSSRGALFGCPICAPKKNSQKPRNRSALPENGLVNKFSSRSQRAQGTSGLHPHEGSFESHGVNQISRFDMLINLEKDQKLVQVDVMPQLRLAPPAVYHERIKKGADLLNGESSAALAKLDKPGKFRPPRDIKMKGSSLRFPLKTSIFGKEKTGRR